MYVCVCVVVTKWQSPSAAIRIMTGNEKVRWNYYRAIKKRQTNDVAHRQGFKSGNTFMRHSTGQQLFLSFTLEDLLEFRCWYFVDLFTNSIGVLVINVSYIRYGSNPEASVLSWPKLYGKSNAKVQAKSPWRLCTVAIAFLHCCIIFFCLIVVQPEPENVNLEFFRYLCCEITAKDAYEKTSSSRCVDLKDTMHSE